MGKKMATSSDEATMVITHNHATPAVSFSFVKSSVRVDLAPARFRQEPVLAPASWRF
jgi:hypothetical protein